MRAKTLRDKCMRQMHETCTHEYKLFFSTDTKSSGKINLPPSVGRTGPVAPILIQLSIDTYFSSTLELRSVKWLSFICSQVSSRQCVTNYNILDTEATCSILASLIPVQLVHINDCINAKVVLQSQCPLCDNGSTIVERLCFETDRA